MTTKYIELITNLKSMASGIKFSEDNGVLTCNFNESVSIFSSIDNWSIVELTRIRNALGNLSNSDIYHPNAYIGSASILSYEDLTKNKQVLEAYQNKNSVFRCGIVNGSYKEVLTTAFNHLFQDKVKNKLKLVIAEKMEFSLNIINELLLMQKISSEEAEILTQKTIQQYDEILETGNIELKLVVKKYNVFTKNNQLFTVNNVVQNIILDSNIFYSISLINKKEQDLAKKYGIALTLEPSFMINQNKMAA